MLVACFFFGGPDGRGAADICGFWVLFVNFLGYLRNFSFICEFPSLFAKSELYLR